MTTHAMIDLETLGTAPDCAVLTIGAIKFDPNVAKPAWDEFYYRFDVDDQLARGRTVLDSTLDWWNQQEDHVRDEALGDDNRTPVLDVLTHLNRWCVGATTIWCQGPAFDIVILEHLYRQYNLHVPWQFWQIRDSRTLFGIMPSDPRKQFKFDAHNALEDCRIQSQCVQQTISKLGLQLK